MPPDINGCVHKFIPNNPALSKAVIKVLRNVFQTPTLPLQLVKVVVERAFEQSRTEMKADSNIFEDKLTAYVHQIKPRFIAQINDIRRKGKKW